MSQAQEARPDIPKGPPSEAGGPPPGVGGPPPGVGGPPPGVVSATESGFEGREEELGQAVASVIRTLGHTVPYPHEMNDALVKATLTAIQFAKDQGLMEEYIAHDLKTMEPLNTRVGKMIEQSGNKELALVGICDRTACHYHLVLETEKDGNRRSWTSPFKRVLDASTRLGQFDLTEQYIHENWLVPRMKGYGEAMGVEIDVSDWNDDGRVTIEVK